MGKYINPFTDFGFKKLFGTEFNKELLVDFLNQVLGEREQVRDLTYLNTEKGGRTERDRKAVFDLYCENEQGEKFIIELQNVYQQFFKDRSIYYATFPLQEQASKGREWDYCLKAVYTYLEMPKFRKQEEDLVTHFDKWMYVLRNLPRLQDRPRKLQEKIFEKLFAEAELARLTPEDMSTYQKSLKVYRDNKNTMDYAIKTAVDAAVDAATRQRNIEIALELKKLNLPVEQIVQVTKLTKEEIEKL